MRDFIGREAEQALLKEALTSPEAELVAVFGRRRVGKTFLIRHAYAKQMAFEFAGMKDTSVRVQ